jgi:hypothetical protein
MRSIIIVLGFLSGFVLEAHDLNGIIRGRVFDKNTDEPLAGVYIIYGQNLVITTDADGTFLITNVSGEISITFQFIGYEPLNSTLALKQESGRSTRWL